MPQSRKLKFLVSILPSDREFGKFQDFDIIQDHLKPIDINIQERLRKRGQQDYYTYVLSTRTVLTDGSTLETRRQISDREYQNLLLRADRTRLTVHKTRRCFIWNHQYFQLDIYHRPCHGKCEGLVLLETYTTLESSALALPSFLKVTKEVTDDVQYLMYNLCLK
jgi:CYTH domain-containing protein